MTGLNYKCLTYLLALSALILCTKGECSFQSTFRLTKPCRSIVFKSRLTGAFRSSSTLVETENGFAPATTGAFFLSLLLIDRFFSLFTHLHVRGSRCS
jgi:hypothetical protein